MTAAPKPTILLLSANAGYGHSKAGDDLARSLAYRLPGWDIRHKNICDYSSRSQRWNIENVWQVLSTAPILRTLYSGLHRWVTSNDYLSQFAGYAFRNVGTELERKHKNVDVRAVIALHPGAAAASIFWKKSANFFLGVVATDLVVHGFHALEGIDQIFADPRAIFSSPKAVLLKNTPIVHYSGLPIGKNFFEKEKLPFNPEKQQILVTFGAKGLRARQNVRAILDATVELSGINLVFVCGKNDKLLDYVTTCVSRMNLDNRVRVLGFCSNMSELMAGSNIVIGKPGGITSGELLALNKQLLVLDYLPGQEEYNLKVLSDFGFCQYVNSRTKLKRFMQGFFERKQRSNLVSMPFTELGGTEEIARSLVVTIANHKADESTTPTSQLSRCV